MQTTVTINDQQLKSLMFHTLLIMNPKLFIKLFKPLQQAKQQQDLLALRGQVDIAGNLASITRIGHQ